MSLEWPEDILHGVEILLVRWLDSSSSDGGWEWSEDWNHAAVSIQSIGWVVKKTREAITLMPHLSQDYGKGRRQGRGGLVIPRKSIVSMQKLET